MLILTRKLGESITIGDSIKVTVLGIYGRQVRLGIEAPANIIVHRAEAGRVLRDPAGSRQGRAHPLRINEAHPSRRAGREGLSKRRCQNAISKSAGSSNRKSQF